MSNMLMEKLSNFTAIDLTDLDGAVQYFDDADNTPLFIPTYYGGRVATAARAVFTVAAAATGDANTAIDFSANGFANAALTHTDADSQNRISVRGHGEGAAVEAFSTSHIIGAAAAMSRIVYFTMSTVFGGQTVLPHFMVIKAERTAGAADWTAGTLSLTRLEFFG